MWGTTFNGLGHPDYNVREDCQARADNLLFALMAPDAIPNPEIANRVARIRNKQFKLVYNVEERIFREDFRLWCTSFFAPGISQYMDDDLFYAYISTHGTVKMRQDFLSSLQVNHYTLNLSHITRPLFNSDIERWKAFVSKLRTEKAHSAVSGATINVVR